MRSVHTFPDKPTLIGAAAERIVRLFAESDPTQPLSIALSGGSTPGPVYTLLATTYRDVIPWGRVHLFWGDDRFVPHDHEHSNVRLVRETLLDYGVPIPDENIHAMPGTGGPEVAAEAYEADLRTFFGDRDMTFDIALQGMGDDGHTASLFPGVDALTETERWVRVVQAPPYAKVATRLTLTYPLLNRSRNVLFLVAGANKKAVLTDVFAQGTASGYPASRIEAEESLIWFIDQAAAPDA
ncbi:MAG: 6-phosphogluconolactonase [Rhodothermales bacterium]